MEKTAKDLRDEFEAEFEQEVEECRTYASMAFSTDYVEWLEGTVLEYERKEEKKYNGVTALSELMVKPIVAELHVPDLLYGKNRFIWERGAAFCRYLKVREFDDIPVVWKHGEEYINLTPAQVEFLKEKAGEWVLVSLDKSHCAIVYGGGWVRYPFALFERKIDGL